MPDTNVADLAKAAQEAKTAVPNPGVGPGQVVNNDGEVVTLNEDL